MRETKRTVSEGSVEVIDYNHYYAVSARRRHDKRASDRPHTVPIDHPLVGTYVRNNRTGKVYLVERAVRQWWWGWYKALLLNCKGSHVLAWWEVESTAEDSILKACAERIGTYESVIPTKDQMVSLSIANSTSAT